MAPKISGKKDLHFGKVCAIIAERYAPVAQLDRVTDYESVGRGFESLLAYHKKPLLSTRTREVFLVLEAI